MFNTINYECHEGISWIKLNRPDKLNAFIAEMNREITQVVKQAAKDEKVRCIVITGEGRAFCSGQDLAEVNDDTNHGDLLRNHYTPMVKAIMACEKPIIAAVNGVAAGAGFSLALACDFRLASEKASFINAFVNIGLIPDSGNLHFLSHVVGRAKAIEISVLGEKIPAQKALELGVINRVIPQDTWQKEVEEFAIKLAKMPTKAIGLIKRYLTLAENLPLDAYLEKEAEGQRIAGLTKDAKEGVQAFIEKRQPEYIGQ